MRALFPKNIRLALLVVALLLLGVSACSRDVPVLTGATMGTTYSVNVPRLKSADQDALKARVEAALEGVNSSMSTWQSDSSISLFNSSTSTEWVGVPEGFAVVAGAALEIASVTKGAFDPTVGPLVKRWGFGKDQNDELPKADEISAILSRVGFQLLQADTSNHRIKKSLPELQIDLNAIAKGYAVDLLAREVEAFGYMNYLVEIGGELRVKGKNSDAKPWRVGIERPQVDVTNASAEGPSFGLLLQSGGVATSGDYRNAFESDGVRYSHIIDPRSGYPVSHQLASVTVVADTAMIADAWATALMVLGPDDGLRIAESNNVAGYFIVRQEGAFVTVSSSVFDALAGSESANIKP